MKASCKNCCGTGNMGSYVGVSTLCPDCKGAGSYEIEYSKDIREWQAYCHNQSVSMGWHDKPREKGTLLMLIVSEVAEAMEGERKGLMDDHLPHRPMAEVEMADAVIRIMDYCGLHGYDLEGAMAEKLAYNRTRSDHRREIREMQGGKKF